MLRVIKKDLIIFDLDGTLVDSSGDIAHAANRTLREMGFPSMTVSEIKANVGWGVRSLLEKVMPNEPAERIDEARRLFFIMKSLGIESADTVFVGDSAIDCESGASAGVFTIGAAYGFRGKEELKKAGCGMIIEKFFQLLQKKKKHI